MWLRVSHDDGHTWGPKQIFEEHPSDPYELPASWFKLPSDMPPCECSRCQEKPVRLDAPIPFNRTEVVAYCTSLASLVLALVIGIGGR